MEHVSRIYIFKDHYCTLPITPCHHLVAVWWTKAFVVYMIDEMLSIAAKYACLICLAQDFLVTTFWILAVRVYCVTWEHYILATWHYSTVPGYVWGKHCCVCPSAWCTNRWYCQVVFLECTENRSCLHRCVPSFFQFLLDKCPKRMYSYEIYILGTCHELLQK